MRKSLTISLLLLLSTLGSWAQDVSASDPTVATVYFYRLRDSFGAMLKPSVFCDGAQVARMRNGRFITLHFPPGSHTITSTFPGSGAILDLKAGESYYIKLDMTKPTILHAARGEVKPVPAEQGKFEVAQLKPAEPEDAKNEAAFSVK